MKRGTTHLKNVLVVRSGRVMASTATIPAYFRREQQEFLTGDPSMAMDVKAFAQYIAPEAGIRFRFVGQESTDIITAVYNRKMQEILPEFGIKPIEIPRKCVDGREVSASIVRALYLKRDFETIGKLVPRTTSQYLMEMCYPIR